MDWEVLSLIVLACMALFAAVGGCISHVKHRRPLEGLVLGAFLGPIGWVVESRRPFGHRPMVDRGAWDSFHSLVTYQAGPRAPMLQLTHQPSRADRAA